MAGTHDPQPITADSEQIVSTEVPLNRETPRRRLVAGRVTGNDDFFVRTHGPIPEPDPSYRLTVDGLVSRALSLSLDELRTFEQVSMAATLSCAGNRRREMAADAPIPGELLWGPGATGNAEWRGVPLRCVLEAARPQAGAAYVAFTGRDRCQVGSLVTPFGASIPLHKAMAPEVLLAYEMNGEPLPPAHGGPLRGVVLGYIGARSVKWLKNIRVQTSPSSNYFQAQSYRWQSDEPTDPSFSLEELPVNSVICQPSPAEVVVGPRVLIRGYALTGGARHIVRVEVSQDGGRFLPAQLLGESNAGEWRLWEAWLELDAGVHEVTVRAFDSALNTQPKRAIRNRKGYVDNSWDSTEFTVIVA